MQERFDRYITLLKKQSIDMLTEAEAEELKELLRNKYIQEVIQELGNEVFIQEKWNEYHRFSTDKAFRQFTQQVQLYRFRRLYIRLSIAAAVVVLVGVVLFLNMSKHEVIVPLVKQEIIKPGVKKATIKLADGSIVNVMGDSMQIQESKGAKIEYMDGEISYKAQKEMTQLVYNELTVPVAGECYITLDDGTRVWVNADSKLKYPVKFVDQQRKVFLEGEAYFEVTKDTKPFIVSTALGEVNVLGTVFDVKAYRNENKVYTTLVSGRVNFKGQETIEIQPGEQVVAFASGKMEKRTVNITEFIGWKEGLYVFKQQKLESIMNDLMRWYNISVFYQAQELKQLTFTGNLKRYDNINTFMDILVRTEDVKYRIDGNTIILYR